MQRLGLPGREGLRVSVANPVQETALVGNNKTNEPIGYGAASAPASDNFFIKPPAINLPKGGGAMRGVDGKFQVNPSSGLSTQSIPIFTSPVSGSKPKLVVEQSRYRGR